MGQVAAAGAHMVPALFLGFRHFGAFLPHTCERSLHQPPTWLLNCFHTSCSQSQRAMHQATWTATLDDISKDFGKAQVPHAAVSTLP